VREADLVLRSLLGRAALVALGYAGRRTPAAVLGVRVVVNGRPASSDR
jgi:hypothetical protein